jgi:membrane fusion protein, multidrug efflux system
VTEHTPSSLEASDPEPPHAPPQEPSPEAPPEAPPAAAHAGKTVPFVVAGAVGAVLLVGGALIWHAESRVNKVALSESPKPVTVALARSTPYQASRTYVGTLAPWLAASIGPQLVSAYIDTVLVRPGAIVKRGDVLATLDCRDASAANQAVAMSARAIDARQKALASESARVQGLLADKFVSPNEAEQKSAASAAEAAELESMKAKLSHSTLEVNDCVLRAPFDGEVATRTMDPGGFVRPGMAIVSVVDRSTVRLEADVPEIDFDVVPPGTAVRITVSATKQEVRGVISRRAPAADPSTRTVHFEVDLVDSARHIPVGTTGEARLEVGAPEPATEIPLYAASVRGKKATVYVIDGDVAHQRTVDVKGEIGGSLFVDTSLAAGAQIVTEGRALLTEGDRVSAKMEADAAPPPSAAASTPRAPTVVPVGATAPTGVKEHHQ